MANNETIKRDPKKGTRSTDLSHIRSLNWHAFVAITIGMSFALFMVIFITSGPSATHAAVGTDPHQGNFTACIGPVRTTCIVDGDTIWFEGRKIRIADINTPEISSADCPYEAELGQKAKYRLQDLLNKGAFSLKKGGRDTDKYGRDLRILTRRGQSLGDIMVEEGLAEHWRGYRRSWC